MPNKTIFSFVIDAHPKYAYQGLHLAHSLTQHCGGDPGSIHVQVLPEVAAGTRALFAELGCQVHEIDRFGDRRHCNKAAQVETLCNIDFDRAILLDTDTIVLADIRPLIPTDRFAAKVVDYPNPSMGALEEIAFAAGLASLPPKVPVDAGVGFTYLGNCNGGLYSIPKALFGTVATEWRRYILWLLHNDAALRREGRQVHTDQVAMWLALYGKSVPYEPLPANVNYYAHVDGGHHSYDPNLPIAMLHYHDAAMNVVGLIEPPFAVNGALAAAVAQANAQIGRNFDNRAFWDFRYSQFPQRGSGVGSRGENLAYKRSLLASLGIETAGSILDVGCGDLQVLKDFNLQDYLGLDRSEEAIRVASAARPDWDFRVFDVAKDAAAIGVYDTVLCLEVAIHQETDDSYCQLIDFVASRAKTELIISGYEGLERSWLHSHMLFFHEPLSVSLARTKRFRDISIAGAHSDVTIFRCRV
ncbi:MAG TPA: class I SAM-dependent methyltransferase [Bryobacteraceae bacterium]|nr:class I SAM-dependent methyltransferase [Bryobacteraceae bacterium]